MTNGTVRFEPNKLIGYSDADIVKEIHRVVEAFQGDIPNSTQFKRVSRVSLNVIQRRFGSYAKALETAGFSYTKRCSVSRRKYTVEQILDNLREVLSRAEGYEFSENFYRENGGLFKTRTTIKNILGLSWEGALAKVGAKKRAQVVHVSAHSQRLKFLSELTKDDLLRELDLAWQERGRCPTRDEFNHFSKQHTASIYQYRFGSWSKAIEALCELKRIPMPRIPGTPLTKVVNHDDLRQCNRYCRAPITKDDLIADLQLVKSKNTDVSITYKIYKSNGGSYHIDTFRSHFGSWAKAVEAVGGVPGGHGNARFTNDKLFDEIQRVWERLGRQPKFEEMRRHGKITPQTYHRRFGSWMKAVHAFCDDRNNDSAEEAPPEALDSDQSSIQIESKEVPSIVQNIAPPQLIVFRKTGRAVPKRLRFRVFEREAFTCKACGRSPEKHGVSLEADHIIPYSYPTNGTCQRL